MFCSLLNNRQWPEYDESENPFCSALQPQRPDPIFLIKSFSCFITVWPSAVLHYVSYCILIQYRGRNIVLSFHCHHTGETKYSQQTDLSERSYTRLPLNKSILYVNCLDEMDRSGMVLWRTLKQSKLINNIPSF